MPPILSLILMFLVPVAAGLALGGVQAAGYRLLGRRSPAFVILFARGLLLFFLLAAVLALATRMQ